MVDVVIQDLIENAELEAGVFDALMSSTEAHLTDQYKNGRITGPDYANVYLGSIQTVMAQAVAFTLGLRTANSQADLLDAQTLTEAQNLLKVTADTATAEKQSELITAQIAKLGKDTLLVTQQTATEVNETAKKLKEIDQVTADADLIAQKVFTEVQQTLLVTASHEKTDQETFLVTEKVLTEKQNTLIATNTVAKVTAEKDRIAAETTLLGSKNDTEIQQELKVTEEKNVLANKVITEYAQTHDSHVLGGAVGGVVGAQVALYNKQTDGFDRDAEQKYAKILMDAWSVERSTDLTALVARPPGATNPDLTAVLTIAKAGITTP